MSLERGIRQFFFFNRAPEHFPFGLIDYLFELIKT